MRNANLRDGGWIRGQSLLHSRGLHSSTRSTHPSCAGVVAFRPAMAHTHWIDAKVREATADRSNGQARFDLVAAGRRNPLTDGCKLLGVPGHSASEITTTQDGQPSLFPVPCAVHPALAHIRRCSTEVAAAAHACPTRGGQHHAGILGGSARNQHVCPSQKRRVTEASVSLPSKRCSALNSR